VGRVYRGKVKWAKGKGYLSNLLIVETSNACTSFTLFIAKSIHSILSIIFTSLLIINWVSNSLEEPKAICRNWIYSLGDFLPQPSAILLAIETAQRFIWAIAREAEI
jgi:hypothetical protein